MKNPNLSQGDLLTDEVNINLNVLRATMMNGVGCHVDSADIVAVDNHRRSNGDVELLQELAQPATLSHHMSNSTVLCFCTGAGDHGLTLGGPRNQIIAEVDTIAGGGAPRIWAASPVDIGVGDQGLNRADTNVEARGESALR